MKKKISLLAVVVLLLASIGFALARNKKAIDANNKVADRSQVPVSVTTIKAALQQVDGNLQLPATLEPSREADISSTTAGKITSLNIALGAHVSQGQVVGAVDTRTQQLSLKEAQEAIDKAEQDYQRNKELYEGNAGTAQSVKDAEHALENARIRAQQAGRQISEGAIKAPISGIVTAKKAEIGEYVNPGVALASVVDIYNLKAVVFVGEKDVYQLKLNQSANINADVLPDKTFNGKVSFISPVGDENHNYRVELTIDNKAASLKAGTYIKVVFNLGQDFTALQIPKIALVEGTKNPYVYVARGEQAFMQKITVGRELGENIEVLSGLKEGDEVIVSGQINLVEGSKISKTK